MTSDAQAVSGPYRDAAARYVAAGWRGVLPLPARAKQPPPLGFTGRDGSWPSGADVQTWRDDEQHGGGNVALRLPQNVVGVDVDAYGNKQGALTLAGLVERCGALPATWRSTSRDDGVSGIYLYRVPSGLAWPGVLGPGIEIIQWCHRYAIVWPSVHPEGRTYRWLRPDGVPLLDVARVDELPELRASWVHELTSGRLDHDVVKADLDQVEISAWMVAHGGGEQCAGVRATVDRYLSERLTGAGSRHDAARDATARLMHMAAEGHRGVTAAVNEIGTAFRAMVSDDTSRAADQHEWARLYLGAIRMAAIDVSAGESAGGDPCDVPEVTVIESPIVNIDQLSVEQARAATAARALEAEVSVQRVRRAARKLLDVEEASNAWQPPPSVLSLSDELALSDELPPMRIAEVLPSGGNVALIAGFKAGKTTLINHLARCVVDELPFLGRFGVEPLDGTVALFNYEVGRVQYRRWLREAGIKRTDRVVPLTLRGHSLPIHADVVQDWLVEWLIKHEVRVWMVDPHARAMLGSGDENSNTDVGAFVDTLDVIKRRAGVQELVVAVHTGKALAEPGQEQARGASRLDDWADVRWVLTTDADGTRYFRANGRDVDVSESQLDYFHSTRELMLTGRGSRRAVETNSTQARILAAVEATPGISRNDLVDAVRKNRETVRVAVGELVAAHRLRTSSGPNRSTLHFIVGPSVLEHGVSYE